MGQRINGLEIVSIAACRKKINESLGVLPELIRGSKPSLFPPTVGAETELTLVDLITGRPMPYNLDVIAAANCAGLVPEVGRNVVEINSTATPLSMGFSGIEAELRLKMVEINRAAGQFGSAVAMVGTMPTMTLADTRAPMTPDPRYDIIEKGLQNLRPTFPVRIVGDETFSVIGDTVRLICTAMASQNHLSAGPEGLTATYNAALLAAGIVLSVSGTGRYVYGCDLAGSARIRLFEQVVGERSGFDRDWATGIYELISRCAQFTPILPLQDDEDPVAVVKGGGIPQLLTLRRLIGTLWPWIRLIYDPNQPGMFRIEERYQDAGPTVGDQVANSAFFVGLVRALAPRMEELTRLPFGPVRENFYAAAQDGLRANLCWPDGRGGWHRMPASRLINRLLPLAHQGLTGAGVGGQEVDDRLEVIRNRAMSGQTASEWSRRMVGLLEQKFDRWGAIERMFWHYCQNSEYGLGSPVHTWPLAA